MQSLIRQSVGKCCGQTRSFADRTRPTYIYVYIHVGRRSIYIRRWSVVIILYFDILVRGNSLLSLTMDGAFENVAY